jgi:exosome complex component RRP45
VTVLDAGGNLLDASALACMAALRHYRKPQLDLETSPPRLLSADTKEPTPLPLHHTPLAISFALFPEEDVMRGSTSTSNVVSLVDPNDREELVMTGVLTIAMNVHGEICLLDYGGGCELQVDKLKECHNLAETCIKQLCRSLETTLQQADEQAMSERLHRLQQVQHNLPPLPAFVNEDLTGVPYYQKEESMQVDETHAAESALQAESQAEEAYRRQALDYNVGHVATRVREDEAKPVKENNAALLAAILQSVQASKAEMAPLPAGYSASVETAQPAKPLEPDASAELAPPSDKKDAKTPPESLQKLDSDEEEETVQWKSEFAPNDKPTASKDKERKPEAVESIRAVDDEEVDDLTAAIKKKKKKKGKK